MAAALSLTILVAEGCDEQTNTNDSIAGAVAGAWRDPDTVGALVDAWRDSRPVPDLAAEATNETGTPVADIGGLPTETGGEQGELLPTPAYNDVEQAICAAGWPDCAKALRVARCESGPDYYAGVGTFHVGTFQLALSYHSWRFTAHGWDIYTDGVDPYRNSVVAYEIWQEQGWAPWPVCGYR